MEPYFWGVSGLTFDGELLESNVLSIVECGGVFLNGISFKIGRSEGVCESLRVSAKDEGTFICLIKGVESNSFKLTLRKNCPLEGEILSLGRIYIVQDNGGIRLDSSYIPPTLELPSSEILFGIFLRIEKLVIDRAASLADRLSDIRGSKSVEVADFLMLQILNRYLPLFKHIKSSKDNHPLVFYRYVLQLAGEIATYTQLNRLPVPLEEYDHNNLILSFNSLAKNIQGALSLVLESPATKLSLSARKYGVFVAPLEDRTNLDERRIVLEVSRPSNVDVSVETILSQTRVSSVEKIRDIVNTSSAGIRLIPLPIPPKEIPYTPNSIFFEFDKNSHLWPDLKLSGGIAIHVGGECIFTPIEVWAIPEST